MGEHSAFSVASLIFIHVYCLTAAVSTYNMIMELHDFYVHPRGNHRHLQWAFNEFIPCVLAMIMLALRSAVSKTPKGPPYAQIFAIIRVLMLTTMLNSLLTFSQFVNARIIG